jgi:hypothetical protein
MSKRSGRKKAEGCALGTRKDALRDRQSADCVIPPFSVVPIRQELTFIGAVTLAGAGPVRDRTLQGSALTERKNGRDLGTSASGTSASFLSRRAGSLSPTFTVRKGDNGPASNTHSPPIPEQIRIADANPAPWPTRPRCIRRLAVVDRHELRRPAAIRHGIGSVASVTLRSGESPPSSDAPKTEAA